jgi:hypothetical protein
MSRRTLRTFFLLTCAAAALAACTAETATKKKKTPVNPDEFGYDDDFFGEEEQPLDPDLVNSDSGAFGAGSRPATDKDGGGGGRSDAGAPLLDGGADGATVKTFCAGPLKAGDLAVVEIMISSRAGSGDDGEWVEIQSTRDCWLDLKGLTIESPRGQAAPDVAKITTAFELAPNDTFVVADSLDPVKNHNIPGRVLAFGNTDVLKNDGDSIIIKSAAGVAIDTLTYPAFNNLTPGRALSFPVDCAWSDRASWPRWSLTFNEWRPGFKGTPNTDNDDVACF